MKCSYIKAGAIRAIVCGTKRPAKICKCGSGYTASLLCDWKVGNGKTCDAELCVSCTYSPAAEKDLCPKHTAAWKDRKESKQIRS